MAETKRTAPDRPFDAAGGPEHGISSRPRLIGAVAAGVAGAVVMGFLDGWTFAPLFGWDVAAIVLVAATWATVWSMDAERTARYAVREEPGRAMTDLLLVAASVASLLGVGFVVVAGGNAHGASGGFLVALAVVTVVVSWSVVHTTFTLRYARLYYTGADGGIQFHSADDDPPCYSDFAYVAFTIGMTFQVSDTNLTSAVMRATALRHALLSYLFGVVIIAVMINVVVGLAS
ncbi:MAG TPA: DUF1345 domain-containing protein [Acidothermaceae bacterium]|jgi:uncharacterized membrane protein|nr:DUF1345 domain-containing protein [Acidothermaceae bacterium]